MNASSSSRPPHQYQHPPLYKRTTKLEDTLQQFMQLSMSNQKNIDASIKNLEIQVGQIENIERTFVKIHPCGSRLCLKMG
uniref:Uncharacterized protein n=1 Tax=Cajanus cajan TaxID=3821 RepID=A0A151S0U8_CAJCA|nr:hypothetical protein KK1_029903 [Cajanus cajan]